MFWHSRAVWRIALCMADGVAEIKCFVINFCVVLAKKSVLLPSGTKRIFFCKIISNVSFLAMKHFC